jgi:hypothetical protein
MYNAGVKCRKAKYHTMMTYEGIKGRLQAFWSHHWMKPNGGVHLPAVLSLVKESTYGKYINDY